MKKIINLKNKEEKINIKIGYKEKMANIILLLNLITTKHIVRR